MQSDRSAGVALQSSQQAWIRKTRNACGIDEACSQDAYRRRIVVLTTPASGTTREASDPAANVQRTEDGRGTLSFLISEPRETEAGQAQQVCPHGATLPN